MALLGIKLQLLSPELLTVITELSQVLLSHKMIGSIMYKSHNNIKYYDY